METYSFLETILISLIAMLVIFWFSPGIRAAIERGKDVPADWSAVLIPLGMVALFVILLVLAT